MCDILSNVFLLEAALLSMGHLNIFMCLPLCNKKQNSFLKMFALNNIICMRISRSFVAYSSLQGLKNSYIKVVMPEIWGREIPFNYIAKGSQYAEFSSMIYPQSSDHQVLFKSIIYHEF